MAEQRFDDVAIEQLNLTRKDALKLMTLLLLALIAGTALYTVIQRTGVDIALMLVIVVLLAALAVRTIVQHLHPVPCPPLPGRDRGDEDDGRGQLQ